MTVDGSTSRRRATMVAMRLMAARSSSAFGVLWTRGSPASPGSGSPMQLKVENVSSDILVLGSDTDTKQVGVRPSTATDALASNREASASVLGSASGSVPKGMSGWILVIDFFDMSCWDKRLIFADGEACLGRNAAVKSKLAYGYREHTGDTSDRQKRQ